MYVLIFAGSTVRFCKKHRFFVLLDKTMAFTGALFFLFACTEDKAAASKTLLLN